MKHWNGQIVGCPGTIDNDLIGTDFTIGFSTAVQTAVEAVDKIRDTAESHERMFLVEVMGRHSGYIALHTALASGAEGVCIPETFTDIAAIAKQLQVLKARGKTSVMIIVAEGDERGGAAVLQKELAAAGCPFSTRVVVLGHLQRGGCPSSEDRILASRLGDFAVRSIVSGESGMMAGVVGGRCVLTPFEETVAGHKPIPADLLQLLDTLSK
jgi:6-phosphofructokinase 1